MAPRDGAGFNHKVPSRAKAILANQCPRCRKGDLFERPAYRLDSFAKMFPQCTHCGQDFVIEPGFYMTASYLGYAFTALISLMGALGSVWVFPELNTWVVIGILVAVILILMPLLFRLACSITLHVMAGIVFDPVLARGGGLYIGEDGLLHQEETLANGE